MSWIKTLIESYSIDQLKAVKELTNEQKEAIIDEYNIYDSEVEILGVIDDTISVSWSSFFVTFLPNIYALLFTFNGGNPQL